VVFHRGDRLAERGEHGATSPGVVDTGIEQRLGHSPVGLQPHQGAPQDQHGVRLLGLSSRHIELGSPALELRAQHRLEICDQRSVVDGAREIVREGVDLRLEGVELAL